ncbi:MAG: hypothetical protein COB02_11685 [Candidatus Cloacimonadota bacterium]|nr:MAG: hypothetical protein COB02_11685 [Candidatus Cloacimonadota bacterium]
MKKILNDLYVTEDERPFNNSVKTISYLIEGKKENYLMYSSSHLYDDKVKTFIDKKGGIKAQILNHRDEASEVLKYVRDSFSSELVCHKLEKSIVEKYSKIDILLDNESSLFSDFEVLHTPGHAIGSTCYLYHGIDGNYLFTGDTLYLSEGQFRVAVSDENKSQMIESLVKLKKFDVDYVVPGLFIGEERFRKFEDKKDFSLIIEQLVESLRK